MSLPGSRVVFFALFLAAESCPNGEMAALRGRPAPTRAPPEGIGGN